MYYCGDLSSDIEKVLINKFGKNGRWLAWAIQGMDPAVIKKAQSKKIISRSRMLPLSGQTKSVQLAYFLQICQRLCDVLYKDKLLATNYKLIIRLNF